MNKKIILTVAIPTYNRSYNIEKILRELKNERSDQFNILIIDDKSDDSTEKIVRSYQKRMPNVLYRRNPVNLGYSGNVCMLYDIATTPYIWFLCDDDSIIPGAIPKIISSLQEYKPTVAVFNCKWTNSYGQRVIAGVEKDFIHDDVEKLPNYNSLLRITFLSIVVVRKLISTNAIKKTKYKNNVFFQLTLSLLLLSKKFRFVEIAIPITERHVGYKYGEFIKFNVIDHLKSVFALKHIFSNKKFVNWSKRQIPTFFQLYLSQKLGLFKYNGKATKETKILTKKYYGIYSYIIFLFPLISLLTPTFILKGIYFLKLLSIHGYKNASLLYKENINRAYKDNRKTGFISYR